MTVTTEKRPPEPVIDAARHALSDFDVKLTISDANIHSIEDQLELEKRERRQLLEERKKVENWLIRAESLKE